MLAKKTTDELRCFKLETWVITADLSCSQQMLAEDKKGKLFLALFGRTSVLHGCQLQALVKTHFTSKLQAARLYPVDRIYCNPNATIAAQHTLWQRCQEFALEPTLDRSISTGASINGPATYATLELNADHSTGEPNFRATATQHHMALRRRQYWRQRLAMHRQKALSYTSKLPLRSALFDLLQPKMMAKKDNDERRPFKLETWVLTAEMSCSQQALAEQKKRKLFFALLLRTSAIQGCQLDP
jgi:hypothetical protein